MKIVKKLTLDLADRRILPVVDAMQDDEMTRKVEISLYSSGREFRLSGEENISVAFIKPDGKKGWYDTLPNGEPAVDADYDTENKIMVTLAPAMLEIPGEVKVAIVFKDPNNYQLASFPFVVNVEQNPAASSQISNEYYSIKTFDEFYAKLLTTFIAAGSDIELSGHKIGGISELVFPGSHQEEFVSITTDHASRDTPALVFSGLDDGNESFNPPVLRNVSDGIEDNDAATVGQVKALISDAIAALPNLDEVGY